MASRSFQRTVEDKLQRILERFDLPYESRREVKASALHWPDVVWFDSRVPELFSRDELPGIPVIGFEIEANPNLQSIKAAINNLEALKPALGCLVLSSQAAERARSSERDVYGETFGKAVQYLANRSPLRIVVLTDKQLDSLASTP